MSNAPNTAFSRIAFSLALVGLSGCASLGAKNQPIADLSGAVSALTAAEGKLYDEMQAASDERRKLQVMAAFISASDWRVVAHEIDGKSVDYSIIKSARLAMLAQLGNYASAMKSLQTAGAAGWPSAQVNTTISDTQSLVKTAGGGTISQQDSAILSNSLDLVTSLGNDIIAAKAAKEVQTLAAAPGIKSDLDSIKTKLDDDKKIINDDFVNGVVAAETDAEKQILHAVFDKYRDPVARINAYHMLADNNVALVDQQNIISAAMAKIISANTALANNDELSAADLAREAIDLATQSLKIVNSIK